jgi:hypothetical protein
MRSRTTASKKRRQKVKLDRRIKKTCSKVMPMLSRPKHLKANKMAKAIAEADAVAQAAAKKAAKAAAPKPAEKK